MLLDMVHEDITYVTGYAHVRGNDRKYTLDTFGNFTVYIYMGTVGCGYIDQILFPIAACFLFLFRGFAETAFSEDESADSVTGGTSGCFAFSSAGFSLPKTGMSPTMIFLRTSSFTSTFSLSWLHQFKFDNQFFRQFCDAASFQLLGRR